MKNKKFDFIIKSSRAIKNRFSLTLFLYFHHPEHSCTVYNIPPNPPPTIKFFSIKMNINDITTGLVCDSNDELFKQFKLYINTSKHKMYQCLDKLMIACGVFLSSESEHSGHNKINNYFNINNNTKSTTTRFWGKGNFCVLSSGGILSRDHIELNEAGENFFQAYTFYTYMKSVCDAYNINWLSESTLNKLLEKIPNNSYYYKIYYFNNKKQKKICNSYFRFNMVDVCNECIKRELNRNTK